MQQEGRFNDAATHLRLKKCCKGVRSVYVNAHIKMISDSMYCELYVLDLECTCICLKWLIPRLSCMSEPCTLLFLTKASSILFTVRKCYNPLSHRSSGMGWACYWLYFTYMTGWGEHAISSHAVVLSQALKVVEKRSDVWGEKQIQYHGWDWDCNPVIKDMPLSTHAHTHVHTENLSSMSFDTGVMFHCLLFSQTRWYGTEHAV